MSSFVASPKPISKPVSLHLSRNLAAVVLFCLFGICMSIALISMFSAEEFAAVLAHVN